MIGREIASISYEEIGLSQCNGEIGYLLLVIKYETGKNISHNLDTAFKKCSKIFSFMTISTDISQIYDVLSAFGQ